MLGEPGLGVGAAQSRAEGDGHRHGVDGDVGEPAEVEADHAGVPLAPRGKAAGDAGASAERDDGDVPRDGDGEHVGHLVVARRPDHRVRGVGEVTLAGAEQVGRRLAAGTQAAEVVVGAHVLVADDGGEGRDHLGGKAGRGQRPGDVLRGSGLGRRSEDRLDQGAGAVGQGGRAGRVAPALGVHLERHALQCDI